MTSILSSISGYFSKSLILGTVLPVVIFMVLGMLFLVPLLPVDMISLARLEGIDKQWKVIAASFIAIVLSGLMYNLNIPILRWYEGYPWRYSWIGQWLTSRHERRFESMQNRANAIRATRQVMEQTDKNFSEQLWIKEFFEDLKELRAPRIGPLEHKWEEIWKTAPLKERLSSDQRQWRILLAGLRSQHGQYLRELGANYPDSKSLILPTHLGNVIRSFEYYSSREYGIDSIVMWPRMVAIIPKEYAIVMDDAKTTFDFMLNCSVLSFVLALSMLLTGMFYPHQLASGVQVRYWLIEIAIFAASSYFFYRLSINRVGAWGSFVKGTFDLFRADLLKKLGYEQKPTGRLEERKLWGEISRQILYGDRYDKTMLPYSSEAAASYPSARGVPGYAKLEITRGVKTNPDTEAITVYLRVKNTDLSLADANVVVTEKLSDEYDYEWDSANVGGAAVRVSGKNPYQFTLGHLLPASEIVLQYNAIHRKKGS
ncbi:MAG TPA: hypothetical protein VIT19_08635 [Pyrinomonadaceae bacterium]